MTVGGQGNFGTIDVLECFSWGAVEIINTRTFGRDKLRVNSKDKFLKKFPIVQRPLTVLLRDLHAHILNNPQYHYFDSGWKRHGRDATFFTVHRGEAYDRSSRERERERGDGVKSTWQTRRTSSHIHRICRYRYVDI